MTHAMAYVVLMRSAILLTYGKTHSQVVRDLSNRFPRSIKDGDSLEELQDRAKATMSCRHKQ